MKKFLKEEDGAEKAELMRQLIGKVESFDGKEEYSVPGKKVSNYSAYEEVGRYSLELNQQKRQDEFAITIDDVEYTFHCLGTRHFAYAQDDEFIIKFTLDLKNQKNRTKTFIMHISIAMIKHKD